MTTDIRRAAVLGAGTMGAAIAAHLANVGIPCVLLDIQPEEGAPNAYADGGLQRALKSKPAAFYVNSSSALVTTGNFDDDLELLRDCDWVLEAIVENLDIKRGLYERIAPYLSDTAVLSSNTSGLSVAALSDALPEGLRSRFLVTHFFNPPRYLKLLELVPGPQTDAAVLERMAAFGETVLGKGIVYAKDTPNFIANRIGTFAMFHGVALMLDGGYTIADVDKLTGKAIGRPKSATFRTGDIVGIDVLAHVVKNLYDRLPDDPQRELFRPPEFVAQMLARKWLGSKTGQGFYKKVKQDGASTILMIDPATLEYVEQNQVAFPSLGMARNMEDVRERVAMLAYAKDRAGAFLWRNLSATLRYAASLVPAISDDIVNVDRAMRWGFGWQLGPFELWDAIGVERSCARMRADGHELPPLAADVLECGAEGFYHRKDGRTFFLQRGGEAGEIPARKEFVVLADLKAAGKVVLDGPDATLVDLGDQVACLEFHTKMNTIGPGVIGQYEKSLDLVEKDWRGLVVGNEADAFCAGANLLLVLNEIDDENYEDVEWMVARFQDVNQRARFARVPVVAAPRGLTLGGGCEVTLGADHVVAAAETYIGLVELGAGLVPAGGGCKELIRRVHHSVPEGTNIDLFPLVQRVFETVGMAKVATSGPEAKELGYMRAGDRIVVNGDRLVYEAKQAVLALDTAGYTPPREDTDIRVVGEPGLAAIRAGLHNMRSANFISEYDMVVGGKLAWVLCGGEVSASSRVSETYLLELEREAFMSLCGEVRTQQRMEHILKTGKPLRN